MDLGIPEPVPSVFVGNLRIEKEVEAILERCDLRDPAFTDFIDKLCPLLGDAVVMADVLLGGAGLQLHGKGATNHGNQIKG